MASLCFIISCLVGCRPHTPLLDKVDKNLPHSSIIKRRPTFFNSNLETYIIKNSFDKNRPENTRFPDIIKLINRKFLRRFF